MVSCNGGLGFHTSNNCIEEVTSAVANIFFSTQLFKVQKYCLLLNPGHFGLQFVCHCFTVLQSLRKVAAAIPHTKSSGHVTNRCTSVYTTRWNYIVCLVPCPIFSYLFFISPGILIVIACRRDDGHISDWRSNRLDNL